MKRKIKKLLLKILFFSITILLLQNCKNNKYNTKENKTENLIKAVAYNMYLTEKYKLYIPQPNMDQIGKIISNQFYIFLSSHNITIQEYEEFIASFKNKGPFERSFIYKRIEGKFEEFMKKDKKTKNN